MSGGGGKGKTRTDVGAQIPPGWRRTTKNLGQVTGSVIRGPGFAAGVQGAVDSSFNFGQNPYISAAREALYSQVQDPMRLTDPLFLTSRDRYAATLNEEARKRGNLFYSTGAGDVIGRGMSQFTNEYLANSRQAQLQAAGALSGLEGQILGAQWQPYQAFIGPVSGLAGGAMASAQPPTYANPKGGLYGALGEIGGQAAEAYISKGG